MMNVLALTLNGPMMILMGIMVAAIAGAAGGYMVGTTLGKTPPETPLPTTVRLTRDLLANTCTDMEKASRKLGDARLPEHAGRATVLSRKLSELSTALGRLGKKAQHEEGSL